MRPTEKIKRLFVKSNVTVSSEVDDEMIRDAFLAFKKYKKNSAAIQPNIWRIIMKSRITKVSGVAVITIGIIGLFVFFGNGQSTLYSQVMRGLESARTIYNVVKIYQDGKWETYYEVLYDREKGVREVGYPSNRYHIRIDDGVFLWHYTPGDDFVVRSKSIGSTFHIGHLVSGKWPQGKSVRNPDGDKVVDGVQCQMYYYTNPENTEDLRLWVEKVEEKKFLRSWESNCRDDNGRWKPSKKGSIEYNMSIDQSVFSADFGPNVKIVDADQILSERLGLDNAIFTRKIMGLVFAVHRLERSKDDLIYVSCSLRPLEESIQQFGAIQLNHGEKVYGNMELFSISDGKICFPYKKCRLLQMRYNGIEAKSWILVPRETWSRGSSELDLGVVVFSRDKLKKQRIEQGKPENREFKPMVTLSLPDKLTQVNTMISYAYSEAEMFNPITKVYLCVADTELHYQIKPFNDVSETEFMQSINIALEQLKKDQY